MANPRQRLLLVAIAALASVTSAGCWPSSGASPYASTIATMTSRIEAEMASSRTTGLSIALVDGDTVVWARGFGYADVEAGRAADADTVFEIGSVTKTLAARRGAIDDGRSRAKPLFTAWPPRGRCDAPRSSSVLGGKFEPG